MFASYFRCVDRLYASHTPIPISIKGHVCSVRSHPDVPSRQNTPSTISTTAPVGVPSAGGGGATICTGYTAVPAVPGGTAADPGADETVPTGVPTATPG